jgi:flagellar biogenesis protein FliO
MRRDWYLRECALGGRLVAVGSNRTVKVVCVPENFRLIVTVKGSRMRPIEQIPPNGTAEQHIRQISGLGSER